MSCPSCGERFIIVADEPKGIDKNPTCPECANEHRCYACNASPEELTLTYLEIVGSEGATIDCVKLCNGCHKTLDELGGVRG